MVTDMGVVPDNYQGQDTQATPDVKAEPLLKRGKCSKCKYYEEALGELGVFPYCMNVEMRDNGLRALHGVWNNTKELQNIGLLSLTTYKAFVNELKKDIDFIQDYGVVISDFDYGRKCFQEKTEA